MAVTEQERKWPTLQIKVNQCTLAQRKVHYISTEQIVVLVIYTPSHFAELIKNLLFSPLACWWLCIQWGILTSLPLRLRDAAAVWLMHTRVHRAGKCCSKTKIKTEERLFIVLYPFICAHLGAKSQYWDFVKTEYIYMLIVPIMHSGIAKWAEPWRLSPMANSQLWHNIWGLNEISALLNRLTKQCIVWYSIKLKSVFNLQHLMFCDKHRKCSFD